MGAVAFIASSEFLIEDKIIVPVSVLCGTDCFVSAHPFRVIMVPEVNSYGIPGEVFAYKVFHFDFASLPSRSEVTNEQESFDVISGESSLNQFINKSDRDFYFLLSASAF
jgi:hypothetical protein